MHPLVIEEEQIFLAAYLRRFWVWIEPTLMLAIRGGRAIASVLMVRGTSQLEVQPSSSWQCLHNRPEDLFH